MKSLFVLLFLVALSSSIIHKDNAEFKGKVLDDQTGSALIGANVEHLPSKTQVTTDFEGIFKFQFTPVPGDRLIVRYVGYETKEHMFSDLKNCVIRLNPEIKMEEEAVIIQSDIEVVGAAQYKNAHVPLSIQADAYYEPYPYDIERNNESYDEIHENEFLSTTSKPLSTFSIDVDGASYSNVRRFINQGQRPPKDAVRVEELINYFDYNYEVEFGSKPFGLHYEIGPCPWNEKHQLVHIGIQGKEIKSDKRPASNLVFLIDVSGSMKNPNKLPLLVQSFKLLITQLDENDKVAIVTYAGQAGVVLPPTSGNNRDKINSALDRLSAGGSTAGAHGIVTAYDLATTNYLKNGNNRVILATDGDFNVGIQANDELEQLIEKHRNKGIFLNVLGFGMGNYKDAKMQRLANHGNGQHAYIDNIHEARKIFVDELQGTLFTIAKDVKIQVEFNPAYVDHYRLIGYENRLLKDRDFNDDKKDAGEIGAGHSVTVLYEIVPTGVISDINNIDPLKYQDQSKNAMGKLNGELATLKIRHKTPEGSKSENQTWIIHPMKSNQELTSSFYWSASMACFGMSLRESDHIDIANYKLAEELGILGRGDDKWGYRSEALNIIRSSMAMFGEHADAGD